MLIDCVQVLRMNGEESWLQAAITMVSIAYCKFKWLFSIFCAKNRGKPIKTRAILLINAYEVYTLATR